MITNSQRRLMVDLKRLQKDAPPGIVAAPSQEDLMEWRAVIFGPEGTPWEGGTFHLMLVFSTDYPNKAPSVRFLTQMYHPNIYSSGEICVDILQGQWRPIFDISTLLTSIQSLLADPYALSPANAEAAKLYIENRTEYNQKVKSCVTESWAFEISEEEPPQRP